MKFKFNKFCTKLKQIPYAPIKFKFGSEIFGHIRELYQMTKVNDQTITTGIYFKSQEWYKTTNSKTFMINLVLGKKMIICSDSSIYKEILGPKQESFTNSHAFNIVFGYFYPNSIVLIQGEQWQRIRKIMQKAINRKSLDPIVGIMCEDISKFFKNFDVNKVITYDLTSRIAFDSFHVLIYDWDPKSIEYSQESKEIFESCKTIIETLGNRTFFPYPYLWKIPTYRNKRVNQADANLRNFTIQFIKEQRKTLEDKLKNPKYTKSFLDELILSADSSEEGGMSDDELIDQISSLFYGTYDSTANSLHFILHVLSRFPDIQEKLRSEIFNKFPKGLDDLEKSRFSEIDNIEYLTNCIDEVNRLYAVVPMIPRDCIRDVIIGDYEIKKGTSILIDSKGIGIEPKFWNHQTDLHVFRPERWKEYKPSVMESVMPYGFGKRGCLGRKIVSAQLKVFIAALLCNYRISLRDPNEKIDIDIRFGLNMKPGSGNINFTRI